MKKELQAFILIVCVFLLGVANGIAMCKFCWPVWNWIAGGV